MRLLYRLSLAIIFLGASLGLNAQETTTYFPLPLVPDSISTLEGRSNFFITHYWDFCDLKKAFSSRAKMAEAFESYLSFMPYASADVVKASVNKFMKELDRQPSDQLFMAEKAYQYLYGDSGRFTSDLILTYFLQPFIANKRVPEAERAPYAALLRKLNVTQVGQEAPNFTYVDRQGQTQVFSRDSLVEVTLIFIHTPDCTDCSLLRTRLHANINASRLIDMGVLRIVSIYPGEPTDEWLRSVANYPDNWIVGASTEFEQLYDVKYTPSFYFLDDQNVIQVKNINQEGALEILSRL